MHSGLNLDQELTLLLFKKIPKFLLQGDQSEKLQKRKAVT